MAEHLAASDTSRPAGFRAMRPAAGRAPTQALWTTPGSRGRSSAAVPLCHENSEVIAGVALAPAFEESEHSDTANPDFCVHEPAATSPPPGRGSGFCFIPQAT